MAWWTVDRSTRDVVEILERFVYGEPTGLLAATLSALPFRILGWTRFVISSTSLPWNILGGSRSSRFLKPGAQSCRS
jgi:hypothetical protein